MSERRGTTQEKTYRSRNRALSALVRGDKNIVVTEKDFDSDIAIDLIDSAYVLARAGSAGTDSATVNTLISAALDSDRDAGTSTRIFRITNTSSLATLNTHSGLGVPNGVAKVGDIAVRVSPLKAWVVTNIAESTSVYQTTGFRVQTGNGTVTRMHFDIVPSGQLPSDNFAVGQVISNRTYARDLRTITAVSDTGGTYSKGYLDFTPSDQGYPPGWDNEYVYPSTTDQTTWQNFSFDSAMVNAIINANVVGNDSASITSLIDSAYINARVSFDSDTVTQLVDSAYIQLRDRFQDSSGILAIVDSAYVQLRQSGGAITVQDEGSSLATSATTLNFTGSGVTASGTGATKTITISGGGGGGGGLDSAAVLNIMDSIGPSRAFTYTYTATANQTTFSGADDNGNTLAYSTGNIITFLNGILLIDSDDYVSTSGNSIVLNSAANLNDILNVVKFRASGSGSNLSHQQFKYTASSPTTTFSGNDDNGNSLTYEAGELQVYLNGILLIDSQDYTASNGTSIVLTAATDSDDVLAVSRYIGGNSSITNNVVSRQDVYVYTTASPTTTITGSDDNSATLSYIVGQIQVFQNGILLIDSADYTAAGSGTITLNAATDSGDTIVIQSLRGANTALDSADVLAITGGSGGGTDSATVISLSGELKGNMFRINPQTLSINTTIDSAENAHCAGPISFDSGVTLTINGNLVIS